MTLVDEYTDVFEFYENSNYFDRLKEGSSQNYLMLDQLAKYIVGMKGAIIAGGAIRDILSHKQPRDIDVYFRNKEAYKKAVNYCRNKKYQLVYKNKNVRCYLIHEMKVELINSLYGDPQEILREFDFTIDKFAYWLEASEEEHAMETKVLYHQDFFEHLLLKRLVVDSWLIHPLSTYNRLFKYVKYGFQPCRETKYIIARFIQESELDSEKDIVDSFYDGVD